MIIFSTVVALFAPFSHAAVECEIELSPRARAVGNFLKESVATGLISLENLKLFSQSPTRIDPLSSVEKSIYSSNVKRAIRENLHHMTDDEHSQLRKYAGWLATKLSNDVNLVSVVREDTRQIFAPALVPLPMPPSTKIKEFPFTASTFQGRPVFMVAAETATSDSVFLDPFHPSKVQRYTLIEAGSNLINPRNFNQAFLEKDGKSFAALLDSDLILDLQSKAITNYAELKLGPKKPDMERFFASIATLTVDGSLRLIVDQKDNLTDMDFGLGKSVVQNNVRRMKAAQFVALNENGFAYVLGISREAGEAKLYDLHTKQFVPLENRTLGFSSDYPPILIEDKGRPHLVRLMPTNIGRLRLEVRDLLKDRVEYSNSRFPNQNENKPLHFSTYKIDGVPYAYFLFQGNLHWVNLRTMEETSYPLPILEPELPSLQPFEFKGVLYFLWTESQKATIYNTSTHEVTMTFDLGVNAEKIFIFDYEEEKYALFRHLHWPARLYRLTHSTPSK